MDQKICCLPEVLERLVIVDGDQNRLSLIRYIEKKWVNNTTLHYCFFITPNEWAAPTSGQLSAVRRAFAHWKDLGIGLKFEEVMNLENAEIRIGFDQSDGSWSYVGRDAIDFIKDPAKRTMNFGWDLTTAYGFDTALHEIGHVLGFPHEHQNPQAGITWDFEAVYEHFGSAPNYWDRNKVHYNIIRKISPVAVKGSKWDKDSIMHYRFRAGLIKVPVEYKASPLLPESGLSKADINEVLTFYPGDPVEPRSYLNPFLSHIVEVGPGEQIDLRINMKVTRNYTIQTFGKMDCVIVLFEVKDGKEVYVAGDDDSGTNFNSMLYLRLTRKTNYILRLRLYSAYKTGTGAVMLW